MLQCTSSLKRHTLLWSPCFASQLQSIPFASEGAVEKRKMLMTLLFIYFLKHFNNKICNTEKTKKTALRKRCHSIKYQLPFEGENIAKQKNKQWLVINYSFEIKISPSCLTSPAAHRQGVRSSFKLSQNIPINTYQSFLGLAIIKVLVNTHQKELLPNTASKLENTRGARLGGRGGRAGPKTRDLAHAQDSFPPSNPNVPVSMASQTQNNS